MDPLLLALGIALLALAVVDLLWTALWADGGAGPLTRWLGAGTWWALRALGRGRSTVLSLGGPAVLTVTLGAWVALLWGGWTLVFAGDADSLIDTRDDEAVTWTGRIYFVAYTLFTMGNGDFTPRDGVWQIVTGLTTASGMLLVTMGASYVISVLGAVAQKRSFASAVLGLGRSGPAVVRAGWAGDDLHALDPVFNTLAAQLSQLSDQHRSYPVLHYYHSERAENASALAVAVLDDALTLIRFGVAEAARPNPAVLAGARSSVESYLHSLGKTPIEPAPELPPAPDLAALAEAGLPTVEASAFEAAVGRLADRRRTLRGVVCADAWDWPPLRPAGDSVGP